MKAIKIYSRKGMAEAVRQRQRELDVIMLRDPQEDVSPPGEAEQYRKFREEICDAADIISALARRVLVLRFHDFFTLSPGVTLATGEDVQAALDFAKDKQELSICCAAGISRSSALAYTIGRTEGTPEQAFKLLDITVHCPNRRVLTVGGQLLKLPLREECENFGFYKRSA